MLIDPQATVTFRPARRTDAEAVATLYGAVRRAAVPAIPPVVHTPDEDVEFFGQILAGDSDVWVVEGRDSEDDLIAFSVVQEDWLHSLYVHPAATNQGIGTALLDNVKVARPHGFGLWVFESNLRARAFYERHGLVAVLRTDGSANEERAPDIHMIWPGSDPVRSLRKAIDHLDQDLATLLELRAGLTAQVQAHKSGGAPGPAPRDPVRETQIVERMARLAPKLGPERLARIMQTVIAESLKAVDTTQRNSD